MQIKSENLKAYVMFKKHGKDANGFKFGEAKTAEGKIVAWEGTELVVGSEVLVETEEGFLPAPDGVHTLEDGTMIETVGGVVSAVKPAEAATEAAPAAPAAEQAAAPEAGVNTPTPKAVVESTIKETRFSKEEAEELFLSKAEKESFETKLSAIQTENSELKEKLSKQEEEIKTLNAKLSSVIDLLEEKPATTPIHKDNTASFLDFVRNESKNKEQLLFK